MKKEEVKILINNAKEAKQAKHVLLALGEKLTADFYYEKNRIDQSEMFFSVEDGFWLCYKCYKSSILKEITLTELISLLINEKPKSILDGKIAIKVENEREFKLLMEHYEGKGWRWNGGSSPSHAIHIPSKFPDFIRYEDKFTHTNTIGYNKKDGYKEISLEDFAKEAGIEIPVFIMKSEDGVDLYHGDQHYAIYKSNKEGWRSSGWAVLRHDSISVGIASNCGSLFNEMPHEYKFFSTKEAAEAWILEANKVKEIEVTLFSKGQKCVVLKKGTLRIKAGDITIGLAHSDIEEISKAIKELNS